MFKHQPMFSIDSRNVLQHSTVGSKIIRALDAIRVKKKIIPNTFLCNLRYIKN